MKQTIRLAFCSMGAALATVLMLLTGLFPFATYALPGLAGVVGIALVIECGIGWALSSYAASAALSLFVSPDKEAALIYVLFAGYYPILKALFEKIRLRLVAYLCKFALFNASVIAAYFLAVYVVGVPAESFQIFGASLPWVLLLIGNVVFLLYDFGLSSLVVLYYRRFHPLFGKWTKK